MSSVTNLKYQSRIALNELQISKCSTITTGYKIKSIGEAKRIIGGTGHGFSEPSKMPCYSYNLPASECKTGSILRNVPGSSCSGCYACEQPSSNGNWYSTKRVNIAMTRRLNAVLNDPRWESAMTFLLSHYKFPFFRWHDSGDIQNLEHLRKICNIADNVPETRFWLPTQERTILYQYWIIMGQKRLDELHPNLTIRLSAIMINGTTLIDFARRLGIKVSRVSDKSNDVDCPAWKQGNSCGLCRSCWDQEKESVTYHYHDGSEGIMNSEFIMQVRKKIDDLLLKNTDKNTIDHIIAEQFHLQRLNVRLIRARMLKQYRRKLAILEK